MCHTGARNETAAQLKTLLGLEKLTDEQILDLNNKYLTNVNSGFGQSVQISTANKIYPQHGFELKADFVQSLAKHFQSECQQLDYKNPEQAAKTINDWVAGQTKDKIKDLISPDALSALTRLILVNAIYFKGDWEQKFDKALTVKKDFHLADGSTKQVDMMHITDKKFKFLWHPSALEFTTCELPYVGNKIAMTIILPEPGVKLEDIESKLTPELLKDIMEVDIGKEKIIMQIPKFKLEYETELSKHLIEMGASLPFDQAQADFSGMSEPSQLHISKVLHKAVVELNEEGTEAAAATAAIMTFCALTEDREFIADRPFLFMIFEKTHNTILFLGKYSKPQ